MRVRHQNVQTPKSLRQTDGTAETKQPSSTARTGRTTQQDTQQIADVQQPAEVKQAAQSVPDVIRYVKQSLESLDRELLAVPQPYKQGLADSMRGYGDPPPQAAAAGAKAQQVFADIAKSIDALSPQDRAKVYGSFTIPYNVNSADGTSEKANVAPPGMNAVNPMQNGGNPNVVANQNIAGANAQRDPNAPVNPVTNQIAQTNNPLTMGPESQDLSNDGQPTDPSALLKEIVIQRVAFAALGPAPLYPINWRNPLAALSDQQTGADPIGAVDGGGAGGQTPINTGARDPFANVYDAVPTTTLGQNSSGVVREVLRGPVTGQGLAAIAQNLASDLMRAGGWGLSANQFMTDVQPLLDYLRLNAKLAPGAGVALLLFTKGLQDMRTTGATPQAFMNLAQQLAAH